MPNVMTAPEPVQKERDHQDVMGRPHQQPMKGFLATLRRALRGVPATKMQGVERRLRRRWIVWHGSIPTFTSAPSAANHHCIPDGVR